MESEGNPRHDHFQQAAQQGLADEGDRRRFLYRDVEALLTVGFLTVSVSVGEHFVVFRTLSPDARTSIDASTPTAKDWRRRYLAASLWMVDGFDLSQVPNASFYAYDCWLKNLHSVYVEALLSLVLGVHRRVERAHHKCEAFCYELYSRSLWRVRYEGTVTCPNSVHQTWSAYNRAEDDRDQDKEQWSRTQAVVASMSTKGGKAVRRQLELMKSKEDARMQGVIEDMVNGVLHGKHPSKVETIMVNGKPVEVPHMTASRTIAELEEEMRKVMEGEQDFHDLQVHEYEENIRIAVEKRRVAAESRHKQQVEMQRLMQQAGVGASSKLVGYSPQQMAMGDHTSRSAGVKKIATSSDSRRLYDRYIHGGTKVGVIGKSGSPEPLTKTKKSLQGELQDRKPSLRSEPIAPPLARSTDGNDGNP